MSKVTGQPDGVPTLSSSPKGNLTSRTLSGMSWSYLSLATLIVLQMAYQAVISRLLTPAVFGIMALALTSMQFSKYFADMGLGQAIIQKPELDEDDIRATFTSTILMGLGSFGLVWVLAPAFGTFFDTPEVVPILRWTGLVLFFTALGMTSQSLLRRQLRFRELAIREIGSYIIAFPFVGITFGLAGAGVWSLVAANLVGSGVSAILAYACVRHPVRPLLRWSRLKPLYSFGGRASLISFLEFLGNNLDTFAVARYSGRAPLGQYSKAYLLTNYPTQHIAKGLSQVLFPGFSRIQDDHVKVKRVYISALRVAAFLLLPVCAGMAVAANDIVFLVLGSQWDVAAAILPILVLTAAIRVMAHFSGIVCDALAELNKKLALQIVYLGVFVMFLWLARGHGLWAYASALAAGSAVRQVLYVLLIRRVVAVRGRELFSAYRSGLLAAAVTAAVVYAIRQPLLGIEAPLIALFLADILAGTVALLALLRFGPVGDVRRDVHLRLVRSGLTAKPRIARTSDLLLGRASGNA